jgi:putative spermidine/putrescine transport system ATP-binding protein
MVFQSYALFPNMTVAENIGYGLKIRSVAAAERAARVAELVTLTGIGGLENRKIDQLSGGQRQRVALARALIANARVIVLDDPMSAVDTQTERHLVTNLRPALAGRTVLIATQRLSTVEVADRAVVLDDGVVVESGKPQELLQSGALFSALFGEEVAVA